MEAFLYSRVISLNSACIFLGIFSETNLRFTYLFFDLPLDWGDNLLKILIKSQMVT